MTRNNKEVIDKYTKNMFFLLIIVLALYIFLTFYFLGINFESFRLFNFDYNTNSNFFDVVVLISVIPMLIFLFFSVCAGEMKKIIVGERAGNVARFVKKIFFACALIAGLLLIVTGCMVSFISDTAYMCIMIFLLCTIVFVMDVVIFLERISEPGSKQKVKNTKYKIKYRYYEDFKKYLTLKLNVKEFKQFDETHCKLEYSTSVIDNEIKCFVLVHLDKMNRRVFEDYYEEGFANFLDYEFKDLDIINKEFYVYYIFVVEETNEAFNELISSITPMQDRYYFLGVGLDIKNRDLYITGYNKKKYKNKYDILVNDFNEIIHDMIEK